MQRVSGISHEQSHSPHTSRPQKSSRLNGSAHTSKADLTHRMRGRARFRIRQRRDDQDYFDSLANRLRRMRGVRKVETNATTSSLLVHHEGDLDEVVEAILGDCELAKMIDLVLQSPPVAHRLRKQITVLDNAVQRLSTGGLDLGTLASFGLLGLAGVHLVTGQQLASAVSLAWYATELLRRSSSGEPIGTPPDYRFGKQIRLVVTRPSGNSSRHLYLHRPAQQRPDALRHARAQCHFFDINDFGETLFLDRHDRESVDFGYI
jgi:hypothetical protein